MCDAWTSTTLQKFVGVTYHYVSSSLTCESETFCIFELAASHSWHVLTTALALRLEEHFSSDATLVTTVTDNGSNFLKLAKSLYTNLDVAAIEHIGADSWDEPGEVDDPLATYSWRCVAHTLDLVVKNVFRTHAEPALQKIRDIVLLIRQSANKRTILKKVQQSDNVETLIPLLDVKTRWSSTYHMLSRFITLWSSITKFILSGALDGDDIDIPTVHDIEVATAFVTLLKPAAEFVKYLEGQKYVTLALVPFELIEVRNFWQEFSSSDHLVRTLRDALLQEMESYFQHIWTEPNLALAAAALHPLHGHLDFIDGCLRDRVWDYLEALIDDFDGTIGEGITQVQNASGFPLPSYSASSRDTMSSALKKLRQFFESKPFTSHVELCPLSWWQTMKQTAECYHFICLFPLVQILFCIPATSAPSERLFSFSASLMPKLRANMLSSTLEDLFVIGQYARGATEGDDESAEKIVVEVAEQVQKNISSTVLIE